MQTQTQTQGRSPDDVLLATFRIITQKNEVRTAAEGRPIYDEIEVVEIRRPGSREYTPYPADSHSHWQINPYSGEQLSTTYAERFPRQYAQFRAQQQQTKSGTPLDNAAWLTEGKRAELKAQNIYIVEQLAAVDGQELKNLGPLGRDLKNQAIEYLERSKVYAVDTQLAAEMEAMRARNAVLEEDIEALKRSGGEGQFKEMTTDQIRDYITAQTGVEPIGNNSRKALVRMALEARPDKAA